MGIGIGISSSSFDSEKDRFPYWYEGNPTGLKPPPPYKSGPAFDAPEILRPNPNPNNFIIIQAEEVGSFLIIDIKYPDCTNYEGNKILVFENTTGLDLLKQHAIDPHFSENKDYKSPVARFVPTKEGWMMAIKFAQMMKEQK